MDVVVHWILLGSVVVFIIYVLVAAFKSEVRERGPRRTGRWRVNRKFAKAKMITMAPSDTATPPAAAAIPVSG